MRSLQRAFLSVLIGSLSSPLCRVSGCWMSLCLVNCALSVSAELKKKKKRKRKCFASSRASVTPVFTAVFVALNIILLVCNVLQMSWKYSNGTFFFFYIFNETHKNVNLCSHERATSAPSALSSRHFNWERETVWSCCYNPLILSPALRWRVKSFIEKHLNVLKN